MPNHADVRDALEIRSRNELLELIDLFGKGHRPRAEEQGVAGIRQMLLAFWDTPRASKVVKRQMADKLQLD